MRLPRLFLLTVSAGFAGVAGAASLEERVELLFRPPLAEAMALSPDGHRIAYTARTGRELAIVIMNLEGTGPRRRVVVEPERGTAAGDDATPVQLRFLRWATVDRLVYAPTERVLPLPPVPAADGRLLPNPDGPTIVAPILAVDADGGQRGTLVDAAHFTETPADARRTLADLLRTPKELEATRSESIRWRMPHLEILGFLPNDRHQLILETRGAYSVPSQHLVDIRTGSVREFGGEWPSPPQAPLVFDWYRLKVVGERRAAARPTTAWQDEELGRVQTELERKFPRRVVEILDWTETRARVLARVTGGSDPGRVFVYQRPEDLVVEVLRRCPWLPAAKLNETRFFEFPTSDGARLSGYVTWPAKPRPGHPALLVLFPTGFPGRAQAAFDPEAEVFADAGHVVVRLNHRSVGGVRPEDITGLRAAVDRVSVDDARAAIEGIAARNPQRPFDRGRVAAMGRGFGGYLAVRALQLQPGVFRCGIALDAPLDLRGWLQSSGSGASADRANAPRDIPAELIDHAGVEWGRLSVPEQAERLTNPLLLLSGTEGGGAIRGESEALAARLQGLGRPIEHLGLEPDFAAGLPGARAAVYRRVSEFLDRGFSRPAGQTRQAKEVE